MSRVHVTIDKLVLPGLEPSERAALVESLRHELSRTLANPANRAAWANSRRTPVVKLGGMPLEPSTAGATKFGGQLARAIIKGPKA